MNSNKILEATPTLLSTYLKGEGIGTLLSSRPTATNLSIPIKSTGIVSTRTVNAGKPQEEIARPPTKALFQNAQIKSANPMA